MDGSTVPLRLVGVRHQLASDRKTLVFFPTFLEATGKQQALGSLYVRLGKCGSGSKCAFNTIERLGDFQLVVVSGRQLKQSIRIVGSRYSRHVRLQSG